MAKKETTDVSNQTETEYFVVYSDKRENPHCRNPWQVYEDLKADKGWPLRPPEGCFETRCSDENPCSEEKPTCVRKNPDQELILPKYSNPEPTAIELGFAFFQHWYKEASEEEKSLKKCQANYYQCVHPECKKVRRIPEFCVSIGELAPKILEKFRNKTRSIKRKYGPCMDEGIKDYSDIKEDDEFFLLSKDDFHKLDRTEAYTQAQLAYDCNVEERRRWVKKHPEAEPLRVLWRCVQLAKKLQINYDEPPVADLGTQDSSLTRLLPKIWSLQTFKNMRERLTDHATKK